MNSTKEKIGKGTVIMSVFSGIGCTVLTLLYQYFFELKPGKSDKLDDGKVIEIEIYEELVAENEELKNENDRLGQEKTEYLDLLTEAKKTIEELQMQEDSDPAVHYSSLSLMVNGEDIPINKSNAMITCDGRDYISQEIFEIIVPDDQTITIKDGVLYIGKVITESSSLFDEVTVDCAGLWKTDSVNDSYGNHYTNALCPQNYHTYIIVNLNRKFSFLKFKLAVQEEGNSDAIITVKADDTIVYTSPELSITTEPFEIEDIPLNHCSLLTIQVDSGPNNGMGMGFQCIIADPVVYN